jgi:hypothetical protein
LWWWAWKCKRTLWQVEVMLWWQAVNSKSFVSRRYREASVIVSEFEKGVKWGWVDQWLKDGAALESIERRCATGRWGARTGIIPKQYQF